MILYHFNFGFPLLTEATRIHFPSTRVVPRDEGTPVASYDVWQAPEAGYQERVYYHQEMDGQPVSAMIHNPSFPVAGSDGSIPLTVSLSWSRDQLPKLVQWKMPGAGLHVLGIEPANCHVEGRAAERAKGSLQMLEPGESRHYDLVLEVLVSEMTGNDKVGSDDF